MSFDADTLMRLLPAIQRIRDAEQAGVELAALAELDHPTAAQQQRLEALRQDAGCGPLKALLTAFADEFAVLEENLAQLYDDLFIETCADWVIPYLGDLIGYQPLHPLGPQRGLARAEVAHTVALRRRKGSASALEQLARDVTGWNARAVEYFQLLGATQYLNHRRAHSRYAPDMRQWQPLARRGGAFDTLAHSVDVRRIDGGRGRFNIANVGIFLWRLNAYRHTRSPALRADDRDERRYLVSPLGQPLPLYSNPVAEQDIAHLAEPVNVPEPIARRELYEHLALYYGSRESAEAQSDNTDPSIVLYADGSEVPREQVVACNLADHGAGWAHLPPSGKYGIDPVLGRIALAADLTPPERLTVTYHYGFAAAIGGGEYDRERPADAPGTRVRRVPAQHATLRAALSAVNGNGVVEIGDSGRYRETLAVAVKAGGQVTLRAAAGCRPTLALDGDLTVTGSKDSAFTLEGLLITGAGLRAPAGAGNRLARLRIAHATLVPGLALDAGGEPQAPGRESVRVDCVDVAVTLERAILGPLRIDAAARVAAADCIIDAGAATSIAYAAPEPADAAPAGAGDPGPGGTLSLVACTVIGRINAAAFGLVSNSILFARAAPAGTLAPVNALRRQSGCVRFCWLPPASRVPRRHRCQPDDAAAQPTPHFSSLRYGTAAYCQLARSTPDAIRRGADDESEMGAFHLLFSAQRESNLQIRLREFLRAGLAAGIFYET